jgi:glycosyltransferase involved in cell wall biosynthesis
VVGKANRYYYQTFGVDAERLYLCPHSIDVKRFAEPAESYEKDALLWRHEMGISDDRCVILFAGKFMSSKHPIELMRAVQTLPESAVLVMVGGGELESEVKAIAAANPERFRVMPFQNQSRMPVVYRLGDLFVLPSVSGETWGLAVNEALACGRPVLVSDRVGCEADVVDPSCGQVFSCDDPLNLMQALREMTQNRHKLEKMKQAARKKAWSFDIPRTESAMMACISRVTEPMRPSAYYSPDPFRAG